MRKVNFTKWWKGPNDRRWNSKQSRGVFHGWSTALDTTSKPPREYVVGIIEEFNGKVHEIRPKHIQFKDYDIMTNAGIMEPIEKDVDSIMNTLRTILRIEGEG